MSRREVPRLVVITSWGVGDSRRRLPPAFRAFVAPVLLRAELTDKQRQEQLVRASDRIWTIARPSRLTDAPPTRNCRTGGQLRYSSRSTTPRADLAEFIVRCLENSTHRHETVEISAT